MADRTALLKSRLQALVPLVWLDQGKQAIAGMEVLSRDAVALAKLYPRDIAIVQTQARIGTRLANAMSWTYDVGKERNAYRSAIPISDHSVAMYKGLVTKYPANRDAKFGLLTAYMTRALIHFDLEDWQKAHLSLAAAEQLAEAMLAKDPDDSDLARRLQTYRGQHAPILIELGRDEEGIAMAKQVLADSEKLLRGEPDNPGYLRDYASARMFVGETLLLARRKAEGCHYYALALEGWREIGRRSAITPLNQSNDVEPIQKAVKTCVAEGHLKG